MNHELYKSYSSDNFRSDSKLKNFISTSVAHSHSKAQDTLDELLSSIDEMPDFHDPYSDVSLFLSERIKEEIKHCQTEKKWSLKFQEQLIQKISPDFRKKFPHYRLGVMALKKTWEKVIYYTQQLEGHTEALSSDGSLNTEFFIRENLKQYTHLHQSPSPVAYHYAHQLAGKISEFAATIDGKKPEWDFLTRMIWSMQKHLLAGSIENLQSPYDERDKADVLIQKTLLEFTSKEPLIEQKELEEKIMESLRSLHELAEFSTLDKIGCYVSSLLAEKLYPHSEYHLKCSHEQKNAITHFIERHSALYKTTNTAPVLSDLVRRIIALYTLATQLPKDLTEEKIFAAVDGCYPIVKNDRPAFHQSVYAFISAELLLMRNDLYCKSVDFVKKAVYQSYQETKHLPGLEGNAINLLPIVLWKMLSETEGFLEKLPYKIGQRMDEEIGHILVDRPSLSFDAIVKETVRFFQMAKEVSAKKKEKDLQQKAYLASLQGDMVAILEDIDSELPLIKLIKEKINQEIDFDPAQITALVFQEYLQKHPNLSIYAAQLSSKIGTYVKCLWYKSPSPPYESTFARFLAWHERQARSKHMLTRQELLEKLPEICIKSLPLLPFDRSYFDSLFPSPEEKEYA